MTTTEYLTVADALEKVLSVMTPLETVHVSLAQSLGRVLAEPIVSQDPLPPFANSSMDGYALRAEDIRLASEDNPAELKVIGEAAAGTLFEGELTAGTAVRIMTGAPAPEGATAVIPVESTDEAYKEADRPLPEAIKVFRPLKHGDYIRLAGSDIPAGLTVMEPGHVIRPQEIGLLASLGIAQVPVIRQPKVAILATGDELIPVEEPLTPGKIRNSNGYTQAAQIETLGAEAIILGVAKDTEEDVRGKLQAGLDAGVDLFISSAGVSVGVYDVVTAVLKEQGNVDFWKVRMRPGKPLAFGTYAGVPYLGLPGNPVSAAVSFERFARPSILKLSGYAELNRPQITVTMLEEIKSDGRESYIRAIVMRDGDRYTAVQAGGQDSHMLSVMTKSNALVIVPEGIKWVATGTQLQAMMIDWPNTVF